MKSIVLEGHHIQGPCQKCRAFVDATFSYGPVELEPGLIVEDVMRATCDKCGQVVATTPQSAHRFKAALDDKKQRRTTLRLPQELQDFICLNLSSVGADVTHAELYFRALLLACRQREEEVGKLLRKVSDPVLDRPYRATVNLTLGHHLADVLDRLQQVSGIANISEIFRKLLVLADGKLAEAVEQECTRLAFAYA